MTKERESHCDSNGLQQEFYCFAFEFDNLLLNSLILNICRIKYPTIKCLFAILALQPNVVVFSQSGSGFKPPRFRVFLITQNDAPQSVGFLWTSDQSVAETSTWQHSTITTDKHPCPSGIRTHNLSRRAAANLRLRERGHWDRHHQVQHYRIFHYESTSNH
jgi:hypothetical protein